MTITPTDFITILDVLLALMLVIHISNLSIGCKRRILKIQRFYGKRSNVVNMGYFRLLCNSLFGSEKMGWTKITASTLLIVSFVLLALHGSIFGLVGLVTVGVLGLVKIYHSLMTRYYGL